MLKDLPNYITTTFYLTTLATFVFFYIAIKKSAYGNKANIISLGLIIWLVIQLILSTNLVYVKTIGNIPPLFPILGFLPMIILIIILFNNNVVKHFIDSLPLAHLTFLSTIRIPVEIVLWWLFLYNALPEMATFEGRNLDIIAGITAPFIAYFGYVKGKLNNKILLVWNILGLLLLINIVVIALFSFPTAFQQLNFDQPNIAMLYFPFFWLPSFIVPIVLFSHFVSIRQLLGK